MNELEEHINKFGNWDNYYQHLLATYGHTKEQTQNFIKRTHTPEMQSRRGKKNTSAQQSLKGKIGGKHNTSEQQRTKAFKSAKIRYEGSNEQLKPWEALDISRRTYYYRQKKG